LQSTDVGHLSYYHKHRAASRHTDIFLDCRDSPPEPVDLQCIERAIAQSIAMADAAEDRRIEVV